MQNPNIKGTGTIRAELWACLDRALGPLLKRAYKKRKEPKSHAFVARRGDDGHTPLGQHQPSFDSYNAFKDKLIRRVYERMPFPKDRVIHGGYYAVLTLHYLTVYDVSPGRELYGNDSRQGSWPLPKDVPELFHISRLETKLIAKEVIAEEER